MKKIFVVLLATIQLFGLAACGGGSTTSTPPDADISPASSSMQEPATPESTSTAGGAAAGGSVEANGVEISEVEANIVVRAEPTIEGGFCLFTTNNNDFVVDDIEVQILFKDTDGTLLGQDSDGHDMVLPHATVVSPVQPHNVPQYAGFETLVVAEIGTNPRYENHSEFVAIEANKGESGVMIQITNNSDVEIREVEYVVVFYLGAEIASVGYCQDVYDVRASQTVVEEVRDYGIDYDSFEVYLNQAHTFG